MMLPMTPIQPAKLLLIAERRDPRRAPGAPLRRYRLARMQPPATRGKRAVRFAHLARIFD
jgi:hypothetical protein